MRIVKWLRAEINRDDLDFRERKFLLLSIVADLFVLCVFLADIALKENTVEIIALGVTVVVAPVISLTRGSYLSCFRLPSFTAEDLTEERFTGSLLPIFT